MIKQIKIDGQDLEGVIIEGIENVAGGRQTTYTDHLIGTYSDALRSIYIYSLDLNLQLRFIATSSKTHEEVRNDFIKLVNEKEIHDVTFVLDTKEVSAHAVLYQLKGNYYPENVNISSARFRIRLLEPLHTAFTSIDIAPQSYSGWPIPSYVPLNWENLDSGGVTIYNNGNVPFFIQATIYGEITKPAIFNLTKGKSFFIDNTIQDGHFVDVWFANGLHVVLDNTEDWQGYTRNALIKVYPGENKVAFGGFDFNSNAKVTIKYADFYNGI